jgi:hypothetical protein
MHNNKKSITVVVLVATIITLSIFVVSKITPTAMGQTSNTKSTVVRDSATILLDGKSIPAKDFIHLYDSTPYQIMNGHVAAKLPCDASSVSPLKILVGQAPNVKPAQPELVKELSKPGSMCIYHFDLPTAGNATTTDIAIQNPTDSPIKFPDTSGVVIGVNEIMPLAAPSSAMGNMTK